jgi:hypothetical protein
VGERMDRLRQDNLRALERTLGVRPYESPKTYEQGAKDAREQLFLLLAGIEYGYAKAQRERGR